MRLVSAEVALEGGLKEGWGGDTCSASDGLQGGVLHQVECE